MQRADQASGARERAVLRCRHLERVGHVRRIVFRIREAARLARVEAPFHPLGGPEIERRQGVDLPRVGDRRDHAENSVRLVDARAVVRLDALQVLLNQRDSRDLMRPDRLLDLRDGGLLHVKRSSPLRGRCRRRDRHEADDEQSACIPCRQDGHRDHF